MSCIINVEKTDLSIKQANFRKIINAFKREAMINEDFTEFEDIRSIAEILDILGLPYYTVLNNDDEEEYIIKEHSEEFRELYCFERGLQLIAENLENTERYTLIINSNEYQEKYKYSFKDKQLIKYNQKMTVWEKVEIDEKTNNSSLSEYEKLKGYLD